MYFKKFTLMILLGLATSSGTAQKNADSASIDDKIIFLKAETEASYPGGIENWGKFLRENLNSDVAANNGAPAGYYTVMAKFVVSRTGDITEVSFETRMGFGMEEEVMRTIKKSGKWQPAIQNGRPVNAYRRQPVTFAVIDDDITLDTKVPYTFFTGAANELNVAVHKVKPEDVELTLSKGSIKQIAAGKYIVTVTQPGRVLITLYNNKKNKELGEASFEVKQGK